MTMLYNTFYYLKIHTETMNQSTAIYQTNQIHTDSPIDLTTSSGHCWNQCSGWGLKNVLSRICNIHTQAFTGHIIVAFIN